MEKLVDYSMRLTDKTVELAEAVNSGKIVQKERDASIEGSIKTVNELLDIKAELSEAKRQRDGYYDEAKKAIKERDQAIELMSMRYENLNRDGKTILDFQSVWISQSRSRIEKLEAELAEAREEIARLRNNYGLRLHHQRK